MTKICFSTNLNQLVFFFKWTSQMDCHSTKMKTASENEAKFFTVVLVASVLFFLSLSPSAFCLLRVCEHRNWTWKLNQSLWRAMLRYQAFYMTLLTLSFYTLLHPDSIKNGLTTFFRDWRPFCGLGWTKWLMGSPAGISVVSLKKKKKKRKRKSLKQ